MERSNDQVAGYIFLKKIRIQNFKSIKDLELELKPGINVFIGPNGAGKTNILEAINFLYKSLIEYKNRFPYLPHLPKYWSPLDIIYNKDPNNIVKFTLNLEFVHKREGNKFACYSVDWSVSYKATRESIVPFSYNIVIDKSTSIIIDKKSIKILLSKEMFDELIPGLKSGDKEEVKKMYNRYSCYTDYCTLAVNLSTEQILSPDSPIFIQQILFEATPYPLGEIKRKEYFIIEVFPLLPTSKMENENYLPVRYISEMRNVDHKYVERLNTSFPIIAKIEKFPWYSLFVVPSIQTIVAIIDEIIKAIIFLRHPDIGALREPKPLGSGGRLDERATNLAPVLSSLILRRGGWPERIIYGLRKIFPGLSFRIEQVHGQVALSAEEDGLQLSPAGVPDGAIKLLALLTAIEHDPSILLIDEIENSMHVKMLEYVIDELNSQEFPVIVATHSPVVVDLVDPDRILIVMRDRKNGTYIETIKDPSKLRRRLEELGLALSDYLFYEKTYVES